MTNDSIERETVIDAPVERVWELITEAEHLGRWFGDAGAEVDLRAGGAMSLSWTEHGTVQAQVETVEPPRLFAFRWGPFKTPDGDVGLVAGNSTLVRFTLSPEGDGTRLQVTESGFATLDGTEMERAAKLKGNTEGWKAELGDLSQYAQQVRA